MTEILTYHYVRPRQPARHRGLHVRSVEEFDDQLDTLAPARCVTMAEVIDRVRAGDPPPTGAYALTFDDGFADHYTVVYPRLRARGLTGAFYPIAGGSLHQRLLDVHKIQLLLGTGTDPDVLRQRAVDFLTAEGAADLVDRLDPDVSGRSTGGRFDGAAVRTLKRALQAELPNPLRSQVVDHLFRGAIDDDPAVVARELYADVDQLREMARGGMEIGGHSVNHHHLDTLGDAELAAEIEGSVELLEAVHGEVRSDWTFCYPYGSCDQRVVDATRAGGFASAVAVAEGPVTSSTDLMAIPRFDTNKLAELALVAG